MPDSFILLAISDNTTAINTTAVSSSGNITQFFSVRDMFNNFWYFQSIDETGYYLALIALALAIMQFGLPYSLPFLQKWFGRFERFRFVNDKRKVSVMIC